MCIGCNSMDIRIEKGECIKECGKCGAIEVSTLRSLAVNLPIHDTQKEKEMRMEPLSHRILRSWFK